MTQTGRPLPVFHLCSDYARQSLYPQLLSAIAAPGVRQFMYVPVRTEAEIDVGRIDNDSDIGFRFVHLLRPHHKLMFRTKIRRVLGDVLATTPVREFRLVHAHFLYSDGAVALALHRQLGLPYVVAVRNGDVNAFMRLRPDLANIRDDVLRHASRVVFLSPAYAEAVGRRLPATLRSLVADKTMTVPNGLNPEWLQESGPVAETPNEPDNALRLLYVGDFTPNKNIAGIVAALDLLRAQRPTTLTVVGGGGDVQGRVQALLDARASSGVSCLGRISDRVQLRALYCSHDVLVMPSFRETFGLTYIEALSQGVPVVHSRGQGIAGYFAANTVAAAVDPTDAQSIVKGVLDVAARLPAVRDVCRCEARRFDWRQIGQTYRDTYRSILGDST
jgi:glycosyltransferase involved in cell wall biosynthesis